MQTVDQDKVTNGFKAFRKKAREVFGGKVYARQNFLCCGGCASSALTTEIEAFNAKGKKTKAIGAVWYHKQDTGGMNRGHDLYIGYGAHDAVGDCSKDMMTKRIGDLLFVCLEAEGLTLEWDGEIRTRIAVKADKVSYIYSR